MRPRYLSSSQIEEKRGKHSRRGRKEKSRDHQRHTNRDGQTELHTWLIKRTALEPDKDMSLNFLTLTASLSSLGTHSNTHRHKSGINVVVGARERRYVRELFSDVRELPGLSGL